jgi:methyl-accepting chemotaxis protein
VRSRLLAAGLASLALSLGAAGCGGSDEDPAVQSADDVCTSLSDWKTDLENTVQGITSDLGSLSANEVTDAVDSALDSTRNLLDELRGLGAPDTESGEQAKQDVDELADSLEQRADTLRDAADSGNVVSLVSTVTTQVQGAVQDVNQTLTQLRQLQPGQDLQQAFENDDTCQSLTE